MCLMSQVTAPLMATLATTAEQVNNTQVTRQDLSCVCHCVSVCLCWFYQGAFSLTLSLSLFLFLFSHCKIHFTQFWVSWCDKGLKKTENRVTQDLTTVGCSRRRQSDTGEKIKVWWMTSVCDFQTSSLLSNTLLRIRQNKANTLWEDGSFTDELNHHCKQCRWLLWGQQHNKLYFPALCCSSLCVGRCYFHLRALSTISAKGVISTGCGRGLRPTHCSEWFVCAPHFCCSGRLSHSNVFCSANALITWW